MQLLSKTGWFLVVSIVIGVSVEAQETSRAFQRLDRNQDGKLTKDEFSGPLFSRIDANGDGVITADEDQKFQRGGNARVTDSSPNALRVIRDLPYAGTENPRQRLDLYLPAERENTQELLPVVVFIHGGGWANGDKRGGQSSLASLVQSGKYVGVSLGYRLSGEAIWPAQIHDCKAAIRWLRAHAEEYGIDPERIGVTGTSAGGHLAAMLGTTGDVAELEGSLGSHRDQSSRVTCVADQYGPTDLLTMGGSHNQPNSPESRLLGGAVQQTKGVAMQASATTHVSQDDPPFLIIHGTKDPTVPYDQSEQLHRVLTAAGVESTLIPVEDGGHGRFPPALVNARLREFFDHHLRGEKVTISKEPISLVGE